MAAPAIGLALSLLLSLLAVSRSRLSSASFYESEYYGMTAAAHRRYAAAFGAGALIFAVAVFVRPVPAVPLLGGYVVLAVFYLSSFARGYGD